MTDDKGLLLSAMDVALGVVEEVDEVEAELDCAKAGFATAARKRTMLVIFMTARATLGEAWVL